MSDEEEFGELGAFDIINAVFLYLTEQTYPAGSTDNEKRSVRRRLSGLETDNCSISKNFAAR